MSRCFPYPPPGYCRNGATYEALIESIKLQKKTIKTKDDRKKEKKSKKEKREKRQKTKEKSEYEVKLQNTNGDSLKVLQKAADFTESIKKTKTITESFEKSDLTEEYGQPVGQQQPSYSSDSTQNSNKRKRDDSSLLHDSSISNGNGKPIKIRLLKKHKDSDARSNSPLSKSNLIIEESKISDSNRLHFGRIQSVSSHVKPIHPSKMSDVQLHQSARPQLPILRFERQVVPPYCLIHKIPSSSVSTYVGKQELDSCRQQQQLVPSHHETSTSAAAKKSDHENLQKVGPTRFEKKMMKKHSNYENLVGSLFPKGFQAHLPDDDDGDWLSRSKTSTLTISKGEVETCRQLVTPMQPCARYLAEVDMHVLPYTVPF